MTMDLQPHEAELIQLIRSLPIDAIREVTRFATEKANLAPAWSYDDPASIARALEKMAEDPHVIAEVQAIERDFAPALNDGLERL